MSSDHHNPWIDPALRVVGAGLGAAVAGPLGGALGGWLGGALGPQVAAMLRCAERNVQSQVVPVYSLLCHQINFCKYVRASTAQHIRSHVNARKQGPEAVDQLKREHQKVTDALNSEWNTAVNFELSKEWLPLEFTVDSARKLISIDRLPFSIDPSTYGSGISTTSELLRFLASLVNAGPVRYVGDVSWYENNYSLLKLWADLVDQGRIDFDHLRINAEDYEEWDYANPVVDMEIKKSHK